MVGRCCRSTCGRSVWSVREVDQWGRAVWSGGVTGRRGRSVSLVGWLGGWYGRAVWSVGVVGRCGRLVWSVGVMTEKTCSQVDVGLRHSSWKALVWLAVAVGFVWSVGVVGRCCRSVCIPVRLGSSVGRCGLSVMYGRSVW